MKFKVAIVIEDIDKAMISVIAADAYTLKGEETKRLERGFEPVPRARKYRDDGKVFARLDVIPVTEEGSL